MTKNINPFEAVKRQADIVEIIEKFTGMTVTGRENHRQLPECPFCKGHGCFSISVDKQLFNCFQCPGGSTGGDVFTFLSRLRGYDLRSALETLAGEVGYRLSHTAKPSKIRIHEDHEAGQDRLGLGGGKAVPGVPGFREKNIRTNLEGT